MNQREEIFAQTENKELFAQLLGNKIIHNPQYAETEYFLILYSSKGGSSWITNTINQHELGREAGEFSIESLNGKSEKDLIVVTRNPSKKWVSGLWEELHKERESTINELSDSELENTIYKWLVDTYDIEGTLSFAHCRLYNESYYHLLKSNNINKKKLKIVNIDSIGGDLVNVFSDYWPHLKNEFIGEGGFSSRRPRHERLLKILLRICDKNNVIQKQITDVILRDLYYYNKIHSEFKEQIYEL